MVNVLLLAALVGAAFACQPNTAYIRQYQELHRDNPCVQCQAIVAETECSNNWHDSQFGCQTPIVNYGLGAGSCGQASLMCPARGGQQSTMLVALLDNSDGRFGPNARVYAPISDVQGAYASMNQACDQSSNWLMNSADGLPLAQPLTIQCAANVPGFVLPPVGERYQEFMQRQEFHPRPAQTTPVYHRQEQQQQGYESQPQEVHHETETARVINENVHVEILGTTLIPVVKQRVIRYPIKETSYYPIQKKRLIKTRRISKPVVSQREIVERVPATRIVPTFEEVRRIEQIRGTTIEPIVEAFEVTEMLPELITSPPVYEQRAEVQGYDVQTPATFQARPAPYEQPQVAPQQPSSYEQAQPQPQEQRPADVYQAPAPQQPAVVEERREQQNVQPSGYEQPQENRPFLATPSTQAPTGNAGGYEAPRPEQQPIPGAAAQRPTSTEQAPADQTPSQQPDIRTDEEPRNEQTPSEQEPQQMAGAAAGQRSNESQPQFPQTEPQVEPAQPPTPIDEEANEQRPESTPQNVAIEQPAEPNAEQNAQSPRNGEIPQPEPRQEQNVSAEPRPEQLPSAEPQMPVEEEKRVEPAASTAAPEPSTRPVEIRQEPESPPQSEQPIVEQQPPRNGEIPPQVTQGTVLPVVEEGSPATAELQTTPAGPVRKQ